MKIFAKNRKLILHEISKEELIDKFIELEDRLIESEDKFKDMIDKYKKEIEEKDEAIKNLNDKIKRLNIRINKDSKNSSQPPSTDQFHKKCKPKSERKKSDKPSGGQAGHKGVTLLPVDNPDITVEHSVDQCNSCLYDLSNMEVDEYINRQEIDLPKVKYVVTEHKIASKICPRCKSKNVANHPEGITQPIQYGSTVQSTVTYMSNEQLLPLNRIQDIFSDLFSLPISEGSIVNMNNRLSKTLEISEEAIKQNLLLSKVCHFDETSLRNQGKNHWMHSASNNLNTMYFVHENRGIKAMNDMGILPNYKGIAIHDAWSSYFSFENVLHGLCNAHHVRELRAMHENYDQQWCKEMREYLYSLNDMVKTYKKNGKSEFEAELLKEISDRYDSILEKGLSEIIPLKSPEGKRRGKLKNHPSKNLHNRLTARKVETLRFVSDFDVPFTNNNAEQAVRMTKVKLKISGTFRSFNGAKNFCRIRSYTSTAKKRNVNVLDALEMAARGSPIIFYC